MFNSNGKVLYLLADGDDIGNTVQYHLLTSDIEGVHTFSQIVSEAFSYISSEIVNTLDANIIFLGGDDILAEIPEEHYDRNIVEKIRKAIAEKFHFTVSMGIGRSCQEAYINLRLAKVLGKNRIVENGEVFHG